MLVENLGGCANFACQGLLSHRCELCWVRIAVIFYKDLLKQFLCTNHTQRGYAVPYAGREYSRDALTAVQNLTGQRQGTITGTK